MQTEIEAKFLNINHDEIREKLKKLGAKCEVTRRTMRRAMFDYPDKRMQYSKPSHRLRVRDEGSKVTINHKTGDDDGSYHSEIETTVGSFDDTKNLFEAIGLVMYSFQESKRETWKLGNVEIVLDEWPWIDPYIEIEGPSEAEIKDVGAQLHLNWQDARFGSVDVIYMDKYPGMKKSESVGDIPEVKFDMPLPQYFIDRQQV